VNLLNVIRCDLPQTDYLVWKWAPDKGPSSRQNQIRLGSSLRVRAGEVAAFFYSSGGGISPVDYIEGPADLIVETKNLPVLASVIGLAYGGDSPFQAEVYFINRGQAPQLKWGVPWFDAFDPRFPDLPVPVAAHGTITFQIADVKRFVEVQRLENFDPTKLRDQVLPQLRTAIKGNVVTLATARGIPLVQIGGRVEDMSAALLPTATKVLEGFGIGLRNFVLEGIELDKDSEGYSRLMEITRDQQISRITTQGEVERKSMRDSQEINVGHVSESLKLLRRRQELQSESDYLAAHQIDQQTVVGKTAAESLGKMGGSGGGDGGGGGGGGGAFSGLAPAVIALGLGGAVAAAVGPQIAGSIQKTAAPLPGSMAGACPRCGNPLQAGANFCTTCGAPLRIATPAAAPAVAPAPAAAAAPGPSLSTLQLHIAQNNKHQGILALDEVNRRLSLGTLCGTDLGWHQGLAQWQPLCTIPGVVVPPPLPPATPPPIPST
jgi:membrane protease subunit (stomatin/prohibitin family)